MKVFFTLLCFVTLVFASVLTPQQAFKLTQNADTQGVFVRIELANGIFLYKNRLKVLLNGDDITASLNLPNFVVKDKEEVFYRALQLDLPRLLLENAKIKQAKLEIFYQGCADSGFCYRPMSANFKITAQENDKNNAFTIAPLSQKSSNSNEFTRYLQEKNVALILVIFFAYGLLLSLTPCTLPMIPILSSLILAQSIAKSDTKAEKNSAKNANLNSNSHLNSSENSAKSVNLNKNSSPNLTKSLNFSENSSQNSSKSTNLAQNISKKRALWLSFVYVFFMSLAYALAGLITASLGASVQGLLQKPAVLAVFALILVLLALACFGVFSLSLPARLQKFNPAKNSKGVLGVALMGFLSAFIIGPCVVAPLAAALLYIATSGDLVLGALALFVLSFGMGVPLLFVGVGLSFIKAGAWTQRVNVFFGFVMLAMAVWVLSRFAPSSYILVAYGVLGVFFVSFMGLWGSAQNGFDKAKKALLTLVLAYSLALFLGGLFGGKDLLNPLNLSVNSQNFTPTSRLNFEYLTSLNAVNKALKDNEKVLLDFTASWCENCKLLDAQTFSDERVQERLKGYKLVKIDISENDSAQTQMMKEFSVFAPPVLIFYEKGAEISRFEGFVNADEFLAKIP
mgnify:CR=1 FL=1